MERKIGKLLAGFLMIAMVISSVVALPIQVFAAEGEAKTEEKVFIEVAETTETSITLKAEEGYVYAIKVKDESAPAKDVWNWAKKEQYDAEAKTVKFSELEAGEEYEFARITKVDAEANAEMVTNPVETGKVSTKSVTKPESAKDPESKTEPESKMEPESKTEPESETEPESKTEPESVKELESETEPESAKEPGSETEPESKTEPTVPPNMMAPAPSPVLTTLPQPAQPVIKSVEDTSITIADPQDKAEGYTYLYSVDGQTYHESRVFENLEPCTKYSVTIKIQKDTESQVSEAVEVYTSLKAPAKAPVAKQAADTSISLDKGDVKPFVEGNTICYGMCGAEGKIEWNDTGVFENLTPETEYTFVLGEKSSNIAIGTMPGPELKVKTLKSAAEAPAKPEVESRTDTEIRLKTVQGQEYAVVSKVKAAPEWDDTGGFSDLTPATEYTFVTRMKYEAGKAAESKQSEVLTVKTKAAAAPAPEAPDWAERSEVSILLEAVENQEYALKQPDGSWAWQTSPEFTELNPNTEYTFATRVIFNSEEAMESQMSGESKFKTLIPFEGSTITGIAENGAYTSGTRLTATTVGNGMDNVNPSLGDTRWVPLRWNWGQTSFSDWKEPGYSIPFTLVQVGNYRLNVDFGLEEYTENGWTATDVVNTATVRFKATEAPATKFTLSATAGTNGKISPKGNLTVDKGSDYEFTFLPDQGYVVAKVYIDGVETKVQNNKYTFKAVDANHTISVTFEQARKMDSPKTGDGVMMKPAVILMLISAALLVGIFVYNRSKTKKSDD